MSPLLAAHRAFDLATFRQHCTAANPGIGRIRRSSLHELDALLAQLGVSVPHSLARIQPVWAAVPAAKQQKYAAAGT